MGLPLDAMVETALTSQRRRRHRVEFLNKIEAVIQSTRQRIQANEQDISMWRAEGDKFKAKFSTKHTWNNMRVSYPNVIWFKGVLATGDRIKKWNTWLQVDCFLRNNTEETRDYVFFNCPYSSAIWKNLAQRLITINYLTDWNQLIALLHSTSIPTLILLLLRYSFQCTLYHIWRGYVTGSIHLQKLG
ncbi:putative reverse transcriptase zinc-binding domain-containing protein [Arabidopsis thaliana]